MTHTWAAVVFVGAGGVSCIGALALVIRDVRFRQRAIRSVGLVRERHVKSSPDPDGGSMQLVRVAVEYEDESGVRH
jgi:hypothetical protein